MMGKKQLAVLFIIFLAASFAVIAACGGSYTESFPAARFGLEAGGAEAHSAEGVNVTVEAPDIIEVTNVRVEGGSLRYDVKALRKGSAYVSVDTSRDGMDLLEKYYVHSFGVITKSTFFGKCRGGFTIPLSLLIVMALLFVERVRTLSAETSANLYSYRNIMNFGLVVFIAFLVINLIVMTLKFRGIDNSIDSVLGTASYFAFVVLPVAFVVSILISVSNVNLMRREGVNWRNMLGFLLGLGLCLLTIMPDQLYNFILRTQIVDIFNSRGVATHLYRVFEHSVFFFIAYLECILLGTIVYALAAAKRVPTFDKDYIIILGCRVKADGTPTPLLQGRADRALEFARMQKEASGKDVVFVPSGGRGSDEPIAEAEAICNYLVSQGVPRERIIPEDRSLNTYENIHNSMELIQADFAARGGCGEPRAAFSTTNYHVFRAGLIASEQGFRLEGIGSPTKRYFWVNAFIREFVATLASQKKRHLKVTAALIFGVVFMVALSYISILL